MDDNFPNINVIYKEFINDFKNKFHNNILDEIDLENYRIFSTNNIINEEIEGQQTHNTSIAIAAAITAYARIFMSQFKNNSKINLYYSDTDSIYTDSEIDLNLISNFILGKLKLENVCRKAIFLSPKVYCLLSDTGEFIYKVKGLKHEVLMILQDFKKLLFENVFLEKRQTKWIKSLSKGQIDLIDQVYTLKVTDNKWKLLYDKNNKLIGTSPYIINENKQIINK